MKKIWNIVKEYSIFVILILLAVIFASQSKAFLRVSNILTILRQSCIMAVVGMGVMGVIITGGLNLAVGSCVAMSSVLIALLSVKGGLVWPLVVLITVVINTGIGYLIGLVLNKTKVIPMIGTTAMSTIFSGIAYLLCGGLPISGIPDNIKWFYQGSVGPILAPIIMAAAVVLIMGIVLKYTYIGRQLYATGSNREAARLSGINTDKIFIMSYTICGALCGLGGLLMAGRVGSGNPTSAATLSGDVMAALVIGGVSLRGGEGKVTKAVGGLVLMATLTNGMTLCGVDDYVQMVVTGSVFLLAVVLDSIQHNNLLDKMGLRKSTPQKAEASK